jgi:hypothetical protein
MTALPDVPKVVRVSMTMTLDEDLGARCSFYKRYSGTPPTNTQLDTFCSDIANLFNTANMDTLMNDGYALVLTEAIDLSSSTAAVGADATNVAGTRTGDGVPADAAVVVSHKISRRYRGGHPRNYWPFGVAADLDDAQKWGNTFISDANTKVDNFYGGINAVGWPSAGSIDSVSVSYYEGFTVFMGPTGRARNISTPRATPVIDTVTAHSCRHGVGSQRGRLLHLA